MKKSMDKRVDFRDGRYFIKGANIRVDLVVGLGVNEVLKNYPWLTEEQISDALDFATDVISQKGRRETSIQQIQAI